MAHFQAHEIRGGDLVHVSVDAIRIGSGRGEGRYRPGMKVFGK